MSVCVSPSFGWVTHVEATSAHDPHQMRRTVYLDTRKINERQNIIINNKMSIILSYIDVWFLWTRQYSYLWHYFTRHQVLYTWYPYIDVWFLWYKAVLLPLV